MNLSEEISEDITAKLTARSIVSDSPDTSDTPPSTSGIPNISNTPVDFKSLVDVAIPKLENKPQNQKPKKQVSIMTKSASVMIQTFLTALHLSSNGKYLSLLSGEESGASAVVGTYQSLFVGTAGGFLLATGMDMSEPMVLGEKYLAEGNLIEADKAFSEAGEIAKSNWVLALGMGSGVTGAMVLTPWVLPLFYSEESSKIASEFFMGYAAAAIPSLLLIASPQIAFQEGDWAIPMFSGFLFCASAGGFSYLFAYPLNMGPFGVGLGGSLGAWFSTIAVKLWLCKKDYAKFHLFKPMSLAQLKAEIKNVITNGAHISFQRFSEWGNLFGITTFIGLGSTLALSAVPPAIQTNVIVALSMQGLATASSMLIARNRSETRKFATKENASENDYREAYTWNNKNKATVVRNSIIGGTISAVLAAVAYWQREKISDFFLASDTNSNVRDQSEKFLWLNMLSMVPDAIRIILLGALRAWNKRKSRYKNDSEKESWKDSIGPTLACLGTMTVVGVPVGYLTSYKNDNDFSYMFIVRNGATALSAAMMMYRVKQKLNEDREKLYKQCPALISEQEKRENSDTLGKTSTKSFLTHYSFNKDRASKSDDQQSLLAKDKDSAVQGQGLRSDTLEEGLRETHIVQKESWCGRCVIL